MEDGLIKYKEKCEECYKIRCKECRWEASEEEVFLIQRQIITSCPLCGWKP